MKLICWLQEAIAHDVGALLKQTCKYVFTNAIIK